MNPPIKEIANVIARFREHVVAVGTEASGKRFDRDPEIVAVCKWIVDESTPATSSPHEPEETSVSSSEMLTQLKSFFPSHTEMWIAIRERAALKAERKEFPGSIAVASELLAEMKAARDGAR
jgi:hypothetical protein